MKHYSPHNEPFREWIRTPVASPIIVTLLMLHAVTNTSLTSEDLTVNSLQSGNIHLLTTGFPIVIVNRQINPNNCVCLAILTSMARIKNNAWGSQFYPSLNVWPMKLKVTSSSIGDNSRTRIVILSGNRFSCCMRRSSLKKSTDLIFFFILNRERVSKHYFKGGLMKLFLS